MKKTLIALSTLAAAGAASAQSSLTLFGVVDVGVSYYEATSKYQNNGVLPTTPKPDIKQSQWALSNSGNASSRLGFRGQEDLGGGYAAAFWLESTLWPDNGSTSPTGILFDRRSTVSLIMPAGEVRLGRDYNPTFWNDAVFDPFGVVGVGTSLIAQTLGGALPTLSLNRGNYARKANSVSYFLPGGLGGFYGQAMYAFNENVTGVQVQNDPKATNNSRTGRYVGARVGYANGPLDTAIAFGTSTIADNYFYGSTTNVNTANLGASYDFGLVKLYGEYSRVDVKTDFANVAAFPFTPTLTPPLDVNTNNFIVGLSVPIGASQIKASYAQVKGQFFNFTKFGPVPMLTPDPKAEKFALGYIYNLSKRTALYSTFAVTKNENGAAIAVVNVASAAVAPGYTNAINSAAPGYRADRGYGYDFGIRHAF
ncbi:porin [Variovorax sp. Sphag1AA]|uniref:porin n=1 Tax=Variovorax sp. Sphag1AA TaxID=2587027 RepID=UPI0016181846|nr:porin [Variovorax sp. Sphag1AA]MBB3178324.1 putative porin [Variovorax sp. Sphag1AA]